MSTAPIHMIEEFQCPGCVCGMDTTCGSYKYDPNEMRCTGHVLGTILAGVGNFALGMPKGFNKPGWRHTDQKETDRTRSTMDIRLWIKCTAPKWNHLNVAVWAMEKDGHLFVRTFAPRVNLSWVDVIEGGTMDMVPKAINVADFIDEID